MADDDFGGYLNDDVHEFKVSDFHLALMSDYMQHNINNDDVIRELNNVGESEGRFWDEFRDKYEPFAGRADDFLEQFNPDHTPGIYYDLDRRTTQPVKFKPPPVTFTESQKNKRTLPNPQVPSSRRGGSNAPRQPSPVVRAFRSIGRLFGRRRN